ncbi:hypothetical protein BGX31_003545 [Mortierella sp. GBA43]|nr:hypothetical protein BGX31_003545 [Mortierella sp. GBA43]
MFLLVYPSKNNDQSVPGDNLKIRVPRPKVINSVFFYLFFGPLLLDLPSVISSGTFLARKEYVKANIAIAVHYITLGGLLTFATGIFYFTLNQLAKAIEEYTVPDELTLVHVGVVPVADIVGGQTFTLSPLTDSEKEDSDMWDTSLAKVRQRLIGIRKAGTAMLCFYVVVYLIYGITRPLIHSHSVLNVVFCLIFNLDPGTPTIFAYFILSILIHVNAGPPRLQEVYQVPRPPLVYMPTSRPNRPINDSFIFELHRTGSYSAITEYTMRTSSKESNIRSVGISHLNRLDAIDEKESESENQGSSQSPDKTVVVKEKPVVLSTSFRDPMRGSVSSIGSAPTFTSMP